MNDWFRDPRTVNGEAKSYAAEQAERRNHLKLAHELYLDAADSFASVALNVPLDYPNTRSDLAIAAVACFGRAQEFDRAVELAQQFLAQPDALSMGGRSELARMARDYAQLFPRNRFPTKRAKPRDGRTRGGVRHRFMRLA